MFTVMKRLVILLALVGTFTMIHAWCMESKDIGGQNIIGHAAFHTDMLLEAIGHDPETDRAIDFTLQKSFKNFRESMQLPEIKILVKPLSERYKGGYVLWEQEQNERPMIILYENDRRILCDHQISARMLAYILSSTPYPFSLKQIMGDGKIHERIKRNEAHASKHGLITQPACDIVDANGGLNLKHFQDLNEYKKIQDDLQRFDMPPTNFMRLYAAGQVYFGLIEIFMHRLNVLQNDPNISVQFNAGPVITYHYRMYKQNRAAWFPAFSEYYMRHNQLMVFLYTAGRVVIFFLALTPLPFIMVQFFRKGLNRVIAAEFEQYGVTSDRPKLYRVYWDHLLFLLYQPPDEVVQKKIGDRVRKICDEVHHHKLTGRVNEIRHMLEQGTFSANVQRSLEGNFAVAIDRKCSFPKRYAALTALTGHMRFLTPVSTNTPRSEGIRTPKQTQTRPIPERERLVQQIHEETQWAMDALRELSIKTLYDLDLLMNIAMFMGNDVFSAVCAKDPRWCTRSKLIEACRAEDKALIRKLLGISQEAPRSEIADDTKKDATRLLTNRRVVILTGHRGYRSAGRLVEAVKAMNAADVNFVYAAEYGKVASILCSPHAKNTLHVIALPVDHAVLYMIRASRAPLVVIHSCTPRAFVRELAKKIAL